MKRKNRKQHLTRLSPQVDYHLEKENVMADRLGTHLSVFHRSFLQTNASNQSNICPIISRKLKLSPRCLIH